MLILATDMARHSEILEAFKAKIEKGFDFTNEDHLNSVNCSPFTFRSFSCIYSDYISLEEHLFCSVPVFCVLQVCVFCLCVYLYFIQVLVWIGLEFSFIVMWKYLNSIGVTNTYLVSSHSCYDLVIRWLFWISDLFIVRCNALTYPFTSI